MIQLWSSDNAALVLARAILRKEPKVALQIFLGKTHPEGVFSVSDFWKIALEKAEKKYKRLGIAVDVANDEENSFLQGAGESVFPVRHELISFMANRRLADTVEFRRIARKYLRPVRNAHCDGVLFLSGILADEEAGKILTKTLGSQSEPIFMTEFLPEEWFIAAGKQSIEIFTDQNVERVHAEAEKFLHTKLAKEVVQLSSY